MDILTKQNIEKQELSIFLRDLSADVNINLKHMIEDMYKKDEKVSVKKKGKKGKGTPPMKKKDIIIQQQNEKRKIRDIEDDINRIDYFLNIVATLGGNFSWSPPYLANFNPGVRTGFGHLFFGYSSFGYFIK